MTRMPTVTEHSPRDVDSACAKLVGKEMEEAALVTKAFSLLERMFPLHPFVCRIYVRPFFAKHLSHNTSLCVFFFIPKMSTNVSHLRTTVTRRQNA